MIEKLGGKTSQWCRKPRFQQICGNLDGLENRIIFLGINAEVTGFLTITEKLERSQKPNYNFAESLDFLLNSFATT